MSESLTRQLKITKQAVRGKGVVVVLNDEINAAREVTKTNTYRVQTFRSRDIGLLGYADPDRVVYYRAPQRRKKSPHQAAASRRCGKERPVDPQVPRFPHPQQQIRAISSAL